jgi:hypothetical protein
MNTYTLDQVIAIKQEAIQAAQIAASEFEGKFQGNSNFYGSCGFAWLTICGIKGNTKLGKTMAKAGITRAWDKTLQIWNPSGSHTQNVDVKEAGAMAAAAIFQKYGFTAYAGSRLD